jgi:hypothetical protein
MVTGGLVGLLVGMVAWLGAAEAPAALGIWALIGGPMIGLIVALASELVRGPASRKTLATSCVPGPASWPN